MNVLQKVIDRIKHAPLEKLTDPSYLEFRLLPELGLNDRHMDQYPSHLHAHCGTGIDSWQYPNQFSRYLHYLSTLNITSYAEIGCHKGGTFVITVEYLRRFNELKRAVAIDNWTRLKMKEYCEIYDDVEYLNIGSRDQPVIDVLQSQIWDLVLIDGDHSYQGVKADFETVKDHARIVAFHDIRNIMCPGTQQMWRDIKTEYTNTQEWCEQYDEVLLRMRGSIMGIGIVHL